MTNRLLKFQELINDGYSLVEKSMSNRSASGTKPSMVVILHKNGDKIKIRFEPDEIDEVMTILSLQEE